MIQSNMILFIVVAFLIGENSGEKTLPSFITPCNRNSPNLSECFTEAFRTVLIELNKNDLPEMNLQKIDPFEVRKLALNFANGTSLRFNAVLENIEVYGLKDVELKQTELNINSLTVKINVFVPSVYIESNYTASAKVLLFQFDTNGIVTANISDISFIGTLIGKNIIKNGKTYATFHPSDINLSIKSMKLHLSNLFPNNDELTESTNAAINENIDMLFEEVRPLAYETVGEIILAQINNVHKLFSMEELYPV